MASPSVQRPASTISAPATGAHTDGMLRASVTTARMAKMPLESLTPNYDSSQHETYLRRLEEAVRDPRNLNIALTGRYGAGKSSVLDEFGARHPATTQRLAISTLAPGGEGEDKTNRIQKEIVKQLLYGASEKVGKNSRFNKIATLGRSKAALQSLITVAVAGTLMYLLGWLPDLKWTDPTQPLAVRVAAGLTVVLLVTLLVTTVRILTHDRFTLATISAGGASVALSGKPKSFFDEYLDEIVHYFDSESKDVVIFEDLDRFEDPHIFEALRELNTLLNETPRRRKKRQGSKIGRGLRWLLSKKSEDLPFKVAARIPYPWSHHLLGFGVPLQFVYAVKDSVFSKIDARVTAPDNEQAQVDDKAKKALDASDAAILEADRANRTKFFDIVIPLVPFISHRNARDLLLELLKKRNIAGIETRLINTIAHHCTDMRLMRNMCNEYLVFAERLLQPTPPNKTPPGLSESNLFALVAYKNFHLEDFENITRRDSDLDRLYKLHQKLVRDNIAAKEDRKRQLRKEPDRVQAQTITAERLGKRLKRYADLARQAKGNGWSGLLFQAGSSKFTVDEVADYKFWAAVSSAQSLTVATTPNVQQTQIHPVGQMNREDIEVWFPEALDAARWVEHDEESVEEGLEKLESDIKTLREAAFVDLVEMVEFKVTPEPDAANLSTTEPQSFTEVLNSTLKSELARDLVRRGYLDRNFSLYAAQFYGSFTGTDVATFMVQHVQPRTMAVNYDLSRSGAVANLLVEAEESGEDLMQSRAAYNIDIANHILSTEDQRAQDFAKHIVTSGPDDDARTFLSAYFTSDQTHGQKLAEILTEQRWTDVFSYLVSDAGIPADERPHLVDAALCAFDPRVTYELDAAVRDFVTDNYRKMPVFSPASEDATDDDSQLAKRLSAFLLRCRILIPELAALKERIREHVVENNQYEITGGNLRAALKLEGEVSLDELMVRDTVYHYCVRNLPAYLRAVEHDDQSPCAVNSPDTLITVLVDVTKGVEEEEQLPLDDVIALLKHTSRRAQLWEIKDAVPDAIWPHLADADLIRPSVANIETYRVQRGSIDESLAGLLERAGVIEVDGDDCGSLGEEDVAARETAVIAILNAKTLAPALRVQLVMSLGETPMLPVEKITPIGGDLVELLLDNKLIADDRDSFEHFREAGWSVLGPAIKVSTGIVTFVDPDLLKGMVSNVLHDPATASKLGRTVVEDAEVYVVDDDWPELKAVAQYARAHGIALEPITIARVARVAAAHDDVASELVVPLLRDSSPPATAEQIVSVFVQLGGEYAKIAQSGAKAEWPHDDAHTPLVETLKKTGHIKAIKAYLQNHYKIDVN